MFKNSGFSVRAVEIYAVLTSNVVDLLMLRNRVVRQRNDQICAMPSLKGFDFLIHRNRVLRLGIFHIYVVSPC